MDFGLILPSYRAGATTESIDAAAETAARPRLALGVHHRSHARRARRPRNEDYYNIFDALPTLPHVAARQPSLRVGISVLVVPMRNAVVLAKELATIDALSGGRLIVGVGVGWNKAGVPQRGRGRRLPPRGAYLDEAIALWRHLWSGNEGPFEGRFHLRRRALRTAVRRRAPTCRSGSAGVTRLPSGGPGALARRTTPRRPVRRSWPCASPWSAPRPKHAGRPMPRVSARVRVAFGPHEVPFYMLAGTPGQMRTEMCVPLPRSA